MKTVPVFATLVVCCLLCGFQKDSSPGVGKSEPRPGTTTEQKANGMKATPSAIPLKQQGTADAEKNASLASPQQSDKVEVTALPPEIAVKQIKDSMDRTIWRCTIILTFVGAVGTGVAVWTLFAIKDQAEALHKHSEELSKLAAAAKDNAAAAKATSDDLVKSERAWVVAGIKFEGPLVAQEDRQELLQMWVAFTLTNVGKSPAIVETAKLRFHTVNSLDRLPKEPVFDNAESPELVDGLLLGPNDEFGIGKRFEGPALLRSDIIAIHAGQLRLCAYGLVTYRDTFEKRRETRFCYVWYNPLGVDPLPEGFRKGGPLGYNKAS